MEKKINFYMKDFDRSKEIIDSISPTFCAAKWLQVSLHLTNGRTHSCYHPPTHQIDVSELEKNPAALHNTKQKFVERKMMLNGERPSGCEYCWKIEDAEHISDRYYRSSEHWAKDHLLNLQDKKYLDNVSPTYIEVNFNQTCNFKCSYCSPHLSSAWEDEIKTFGPYQINGYEHNKIENLKDLNLMPIESSTKDNPYVRAFWNWWPNIYKNLQVFRMTGGEPLMDANTYKILDYVYEHPNKTLELSITSNLCPPKDEIFEKFLEKIKKLDQTEFAAECYVPDPKDGSAWQSWTHYIIDKKQKEYHGSELPSIERDQITQTFPSIGHAVEDGSFTYLYRYHDRACKHFALYVSLDSVGDQAEYIRHGLDFLKLKSNVKKFLEETENTSITFINTFNILSIFKFKEFLEFILELRKENSKQIQKDKHFKPFQRIWFDIPLLRSPEWMSVYNCDKNHIEILESIYKWMSTHNTDQEYLNTFIGFKSYEIEKVKRNIDLIKENNFDHLIKIQNRINFKKYFIEHDCRRNTNILEIFPEIQKWMER